MFRLLPCLHAISNWSQNQQKDGKNRLKLTIKFVASLSLSNLPLVIFKGVTTGPTNLYWWFYKLQPLPQHAWLITSNLFKAPTQSLIIDFEKKLINFNTYSYIVFTGTTGGSNALGKYACWQDWLEIMMLTKLLKFIAFH